MRGAGSRAIVVTLVAVAVLGGCSSGRHVETASGPAPTTPGSGSSIASPSPSTSPSVRCPAAAARALRRAGARHVRFATSAEAGLVTCTYRPTPAPPQGCTAAKVTINTAPSAFTDYNRWVDEAEQNSSAGGRTARQAVRYAPHAVTGVGVLAAWVPALHTFETARSDRWVSVFLTCAAHARGSKVLAGRLARAGLAA